MGSDYTALFPLLDNPFSDILMCGNDLQLISDRPRSCLRRTKDDYRKPLISHGHWSSHIALAFQNATYRSPNYHSWNEIHQGIAAQKHQGYWVLRNFIEIMANENIVSVPASSTDPIYSHIVIRNDIYVNKCKVMTYQCFKFGEVLVKAQLMFGTSEWKHTAWNDWYFYFLLVYFQIPVELFYLVKRSQPITALPGY